MVGYGYTSDYNAEIGARAVGKELSISVKHAVNVCNMVRLKPLAVAKKMLQEVIELKIPVPYKRFHRDLAHRKGRCAAGRYPIKTSQEILGVIKSAEVNAINKGLNVNNLIIRAISAHKSSNQWHYGRNRGRIMKRSHIEVVLEESNEIKKKPQKKAEVKEQPKKKEVSKEQPIKPEALKEKEVVKPIKTENKPKEVKSGENKK